MIHVRELRSLLRIIAAVVAVSVVITGVTYAALQSQNATLQGSKITSATANLTIGDGQGSYAATANGFTFNNVEPGGPAMPQPANSLWLRNNGTSNLALKMTMNPASFTNPQSANIDRIFIVIKPVSGGTAQVLSLGSLMTGYTNGTPTALNFSLAAGQIGEYTLQVQMSSDAVPSTMAGATMSGIDLIFSGTSIVS